MKLYEYTQDYLNLLEIADDVDPDVLLDTLQAIQESLEDKAENVAKLVRSFEADAKTIKAEEERLAAKRKTLEGQVVYLKKYLFEQLDATGIQKIKRPLFTISIQANPPGVDVIDESLIPADYWVPLGAKLDKTKILQQLKSGETVDGCEIKQTKGLRIR